jgi:hypothetical protein
VTTTNPAARIRVLRVGLGLPCFGLFVVALALPFLSASCGDEGSMMVTGFGLLRPPAVSPANEQLVALYRVSGNQAPGAGFLAGLAALGLVAVLFVVVAAMGLAVTKWSKVAGAAYALAGLLGAGSAAALALGLGMRIDAFNFRELVSIVPLVGFKLYLASCLLSCAAGGAALFLLERGGRSLGASLGLAGALAGGGVLVVALPAFAITSLYNPRVPEACDPNRTPSGITADELLGLLPEPDRRFYCTLSPAELEYAPSDGFRRSGKMWPSDDVICFQKLVAAGLFAERPARKECVSYYAGSCVGGWNTYQRWSPQVPGMKVFAMRKSADGVLGDVGPAFPCYEASTLKVLTTKQIEGQDVTRAFGGVPSEARGERIKVEVSYTLTDVGQKVYSTCPLKPGTSWGQIIKLVNGSGTGVSQDAVGTMKRVVFVRGHADKREFRFEPLPRALMAFGGLVDLAAEAPKPTVSLAQPAAGDPPGETPPAATAASAAPTPSTGAESASSAAPDRSEAGQAPGRPEGFPEQIPTERTPTPKVKDWAMAQTVKLAPAGCFRKVVNDWLKLNCSKEPGAVPVAIGDVKGLGAEGGDFFKYERSGVVLDLVVRMVRGKRRTTVFELEGRSITVGYDWTTDGPYPTVIWQ